MQLTVVPSEGDGVPAVLVVLELYVSVLLVGQLSLCCDPAFNVDYDGAGTCVVVERSVLCNFIAITIVVIHIVDMVVVLAMNTAEHR